jgi:hypothetical protein
MQMYFAMWFEIYRLIFNQEESLLLINLDTWYVTENDRHL